MFISTQIKKLQIFFLLAIISCVVMISCTSSANDSYLFPVRISGKIGYINTQGKLVINAEFGNRKAVTNNFVSDGLAAVDFAEKCGYIDKAGKKVIDFRYDACFDFSEGLALVSEGNNNQPIYIDKLGTTLIDFKKLGFESPPSESFDPQPLNFSEGLTLFKMKGTEGKVGFIDKAGKIVVPAQFNSASKFSEGFSLVLFSDRGVGFIDKTGKVVIDLRSIDVKGAGYFSDGLAAVIKNGKWGYIDTTGKIVIEPQFDAPGGFLDGLAQVRVGKKWGYIGKSGNIVINLIYDGAGIFSEGLAAVKVNDKYGFIDKTGRMVIEPTYQYVRSFHNGLTLVGDKDGASGYIDKFGYIDKSGNYVWKPTK